jgi:hypothetical protein
VAPDGETVKKATAQQPANLPVWPADKPIPKFRSRAAEEKFWQSYEFEVLSTDDGWEEIVGPRPARSPRTRALGRKR